MSEFNFSKVKSFKKISKEDIFNNYNQVTLFEKYFGEQIDLKKSYRNPLRTDKDAGCRFGFKNNILYFTDFAKSKTYTIISFVQEMYNLTFIETLQKIVDDFKFETYNPKIHTPYEIENSPELKIQITPKDYTDEFIEYYKQYGISPEDCLEENVYCVDKLFYNGNRSGIGTNLCIAYYFPTIDKIKILRPYLSKKDKWRSNVPNNYVDDLSELTDEVDYVLIVKSKKDKIFIKKLGYKNVLSIQMEGKTTIDEKTEAILSKYRKFIWLDNDATGKEVSQFFSEKGWNTILLEDFYYEKWGITDATDYYKIFQETTKITELLNSKLK